MLEMRKKLKTSSQIEEKSWLVSWPSCQKSSEQADALVPNGSSTSGVPSDGKWGRHNIMVR